MPGRRLVAIRELMPREQVIGEGRREKKTQIGHHARPKRASATAFRTVLMDTGVGYCGSCA